LVRGRRNATTLLFDEYSETVKNIIDAIDAFDGKRWAQSTILLWFRIENYLIEWHHIISSIDVGPRLAGSVGQGNIFGRENPQCGESRYGNDRAINAIDVVAYPTAENGGA
jgi:hypothetical protein